MLCWEKKKNYCSRCFWAECQWDRII